MASPLAQRLEALAARAGFGLLKALPVDAASGLGGRVARAVGPRLKVTEPARANLRMAFPDWDAARIEATIRGMWDNLGRTAGEFPHVPAFTVGRPGDDARITVENAEVIDRLADSGPVIWFSAHIANWETGPMGVGGIGRPMHVVYRAANNPHTDWVYAAGRRFAASLIPKGAAGARRMAQVLRHKEHLGVLVDQKLNDGIPVDFFGRPAMTGTAVALFALKYRCPLVPAHPVREDGARFRVVVEEPLPLPDSGDRTADTAELMARVNARVEAWIRDHPEQWLWLHRRWPESP